MRIDSFHQIIRDHALFRELITDELKICLGNLRSRDNLAGIDTVVLRAADKLETLRSVDSINPDPKRAAGGYDPLANPDIAFFDAEHFWELYRRIGDEFDKHFAAIDLTALPMFYQPDFPFFLKDIWASYLTREIHAVISFESEFPVLVSQMICYPEKYLDISEKIDNILRIRYRLKSEA